MSLLIALALAAASPVSPAVAGADLIAAYRAAWARGDAAAIAALYTSDGELVSVTGPLEGRAAVAGYYGAAFAQGMAADELSAGLDAIRTIAPGVSFGRGVWKIVPHGGGATVCGRFFAVLRRDGVRWRIASFDEVALACDAVAR